ncbi:APC family permease [Fournierella sp.]|uniref:APC family permease n=1 Tax=Allofournierella sp. TaxID=1940256 RepID=UPI0025BF30B1|nr:APC family permease [Fournierella sp.]
MSQQTTAETNQKLSRADLFSMAIGQIIGVGIMTMTGIAIGFTGRSVNLAYLLAGVLTILSAIPQIYIGGTANFPGGQYSQIAVLSGQRLAGVYTFVNLAMTLALSMYTLSFADYFMSLVPGVNVKLLGFVVLTALFALHLVGVKQAARLQNVLCVVLAVAIGAYVAFGVTHIQPDYFAPDQFMTGGVTGFLLASIYLNFACGGATYVVNYSGEAKDPTRDIPFVIIVSTGAIVVLYALMSTIAAGVLPVDQVANQPLSVSAATFMPKAVFTFFVVGGAMFALLTTLNFSIGMCTYPALRACADGWLPKGLAVRNKRFGTPHWILLVFYLIGFLPILFGIDLSTVANSTVILTTAIRGVIAYSAMQLPKKMPELWKKSKFYVSDAKLKVMSIITIVITVISILLLLVSTSPVQICCNCGILLVSAVLAFARNRYVKLEANYEAK